MSELSKEFAHSGDPCRFCGQAHDDVSPGPCPNIIMSKVSKEQMLDLIRPVNFWRLNDGDLGVVNAVRRLISASPMFAKGDESSPSGDKSSMECRQKDDIPGSNSGEPHQDFVNRLDETYDYKTPAPPAASYVGRDLSGVKGTPTTVKEYTSIDSTNLAPPAIKESLTVEPEGDNSGHLGAKDDERREMAKYLDLWWDKAHEIMTANKEVDCRISDRQAEDNKCWNAYRKIKALLLAPSQSAKVTRAQLPADLAMIQMEDSVEEKCNVLARLYELRGIAVADDSEEGK